MKIRWQVEAVQWALLGAMFAASAWVWPGAPDRIPTHWNIHGQVDGWSSKPVGLLLVPAMGILLYGLLLVVPRIDPKRANYPHFAGSYTALRVGVVLMMLAVHFTIVSAAAGRGVDTGRVVLSAIGVLFVGLGALLPRFEQNWFAGIRTPWTLSSETVWRRTHDAGGRVFMVAGGLLAVAGATRWAWLFTVAIGWVIAGAIGLVVYSYWLWRGETGPEPRRSS